MWRHNRDVLASGSHGAADLVSVRVHCKPSVSISHAWIIYGVVRVDERGMRLTALLQEQYPPSKNPTLAPADSVPQIIQLVLPLLGPPAQSRHVQPSLSLVQHLHGNSHPPRLNPSTYLRHAQTLALTLNSVFYIILDKPDPAGPLVAGTRRHLRRAPTARVNGIFASVRVGNLGDLDGFEVNLDTDAGFAFGVIDEDEFTALGFGQFAEYGAVLFAGRWR